MSKHPDRTEATCPKCGNAPTSGEADRFVCDRHEEPVIWGYGSK